MNAENIAKRKKKTQTHWHGECHQLKCVPKPCVWHPMSIIWTPRTDITWVQFPTRRDVWLPEGTSSWPKIPSRMCRIFFSEPGDKNVIYHDQWEFQDPKMEVYHIKPYFGADIPNNSPEKKVLYGRYLQSIGSWSGHWHALPTKNLFF